MREGLTTRLRNAIGERRGVLLDKWEVVRVFALLEQEKRWGRYRNTVERVYETRIDCPCGPGEARLSA